jgi:hypothetical protein
VQRAVIDRERKGNINQAYVKDSSLPNVYAGIKNVILDDLRQSPYSARIEFSIVYTNTSDHTELNRERWTASVTYVFRENVRNNEVAMSPVGLPPTRVRLKKPPGSTSPGSERHSRCSPSFFQPCRSAFVSLIRHGLDRT